MATLQHGLNLQKKVVTGSSKPAPAKRKPIFGDDEGSDPEDVPHAKPASNDGFEEITTFDEASPTAQPKPSNISSSTSVSTSNNPLRTKPKKVSEQTATNLSSLRSQALQTSDLDPSIYDYDAAYDALHSKNHSTSGSKNANGASNEPNYMSDLLAAAEVRKRDQLRAKDRLLQKEREAEGEEFQDKEMFVTEAYKAQQEELKQAEAAESKKEEDEEERRKKGMGMSGFYRSVMDEEDKRHRQAVEKINTAKSSVEGAGPPEADEEPKEKTDLELAKELKTKGKDVAINDEGEILDKRELLSAGLNVAAKPKAAQPAKPSADSASQRPGAQQSYRGNSDAKRAMRERQTRMLEAQLEQATKRAAEEEAEEQQKIERAAKSQKTEGDVSSAKERFLQRKREAAAAAARGEQ